MSPKPVIAPDKISIVKYLYLDKKLCIREVAEYLKVSSDAVDAFIKRHNIPRRSYKDAQEAKFFNKPLSFSKQKINTPYLRELATMGTMLYWAEGYKGSAENHTVDFANSDAHMVSIFVTFLRKIYKPNEKRFRVYLYCYSDQDVHKLINFWSKCTQIPKSQFSKPYIRSDFKLDGRKMEHGMIHVRYHDKKLLLDIKNMIEYYKSKSEFK